jgi:HSP20 family molecular chaperone IbpA
MDAPLVALTQQCNGDLRQLMYSFFSFLNRRTDFYLVPHPDDDQGGQNKNKNNTNSSNSTNNNSSNKMGFSEGDAEKMLIAAFRQFPLRRIPKGGVRKEVPSKPKATKVKTASPPSATKSKPTATATSNLNATATATANAKKKDSSSEAAAGAKNRETQAQVIVESSSSSSKTNTNNTHTGLSKEESTNSAATKKGGDNDNDNEDNVPSNMKGVRYGEEGLQIPVGNGGSTPRYKWTQTIDETTVLIAVPKTFRGKDYNVSITTSKLSVKAKKCLPGEDTPRTFVEGRLVDNIRVDESTWSVEGGVMTVTLDKKEKKFWTAIYEDDIEKYKIDTELVDSRRRIDEYDDATQAHFRKMIFDQNQYHLDGPTADEILGKTNTNTKASNIPGLPPGVEYKNKNSNSNSNSNTTDDFPKLPPGVEYIDKKTLDNATKGV